MRFFYLDPGLRTNRGHHSQSCRFIVNELKRRGISTYIFSAVHLEPTLQMEFDAIPHFRFHTYEFTDGDPISGWLNFFDLATTVTCDDLNKIADITDNDVVYLNSAQPIQFMALIRWAATREAHELPHIIVEFGTGPGMDFRLTPNGKVLELLDLRLDARNARPVLCRFASRFISEINPSSRFHIVAYDPAPAEAYRMLLQQSVKVLPQRHQATTRLRNRAGKRPITVSVLGHQQPAKGYHLVPEVAARLLELRSDINILVHNSDPSWLKEPHQKLLTLSATDSRLTVDERVADEDLWNKLIEESDLILCPYEQRHYSLSESSVVGDALANGIPAIVPANTAPARLLEEFEEPGVSFNHWDAESITDAAINAIDRFDNLASRAYAAAKRWPEIHGPRHLVDAMLALVC